VEKRSFLPKFLYPTTWIPSSVPRTRRRVRRGAQRRLCITMHSRLWRLFRHRRCNIDGTNRQPRSIHPVSASELTKPFFYFGVLSPSGISMLSYVALRIMACFNDTRKLTTRVGCVLCHTLLSSRIALTLDLIVPPLITAAR
jgi:hypothetical protein